MYEQLKSLITQQIRTNGQESITGAVLQNILLRMVDEYPTVPTNVSQLTNDSNYVTASVLNRYLPLTGGTLTGALTVNGNFTVGSTGFHYVLFNGSVNVSGPLSAESIELGPGTDTASFSIINHEVRINKSLNIDNNVKALSFIKENGTSDQVLCADGSVKTLAELKAALNAI